MGTKGDKVVYAVDGKKWMPMEYMEAMDPKFLSTLMQFDQTEKLLNGRRPSNAEASTHLWRGKLPSNLPVGRHEIEIRATDRYGKTYSEKVQYLIAEKK